MMPRVIRAALAVTLLMLVGCDESSSQSEESEPSVLMAKALEPWSGDLDGIIERRMLRIATAYNPLFFAFEGDKRIGLVEDTAREFRAFLKEKHDANIDIFMMPLPRDQIIDAVAEGRADIAIANLTITEARAEKVVFSDPTRRDVAELVVTGPSAGDVSSFDEIAEIGLYLRPASSYYAHLETLNGAREQAGEEPIPVTAANENLEDYDLLDMVNAGIIPAIVVDSHKAALWAQIFDHITVHADLSLSDGREIAWAMRNDSPKLQQVVNEFVETIKVGTLLGNILVQRYLESTEWIENFRHDDPWGDYEQTIDLIKTYADRYEFDWLMILAQAYQESKFQQDAVSDTGAIGVMQILPSTASDPNVDIDNIEKLENNVHAGIKYLHFLRDRYFDDPEITELDRLLLSFAAYNAGPANIAKARDEAKAMGLNPNIWFANVETAAAKTGGRGPVNYVRNIYKYYIAYDLSEFIRQQREAAAGSVEEAAN
ncbi:MAG: transglycosylase SLT domain-containing protein [Pseudomonadota bacterium]